MSDVVNGRERIVGFLRDLAASDIAFRSRLDVIDYAFQLLIISEAEFDELLEVIRK